MTSLYYCTVPNTVYPKKYAHGFVVLCFVVVIQSFIMNSHEVFIHIHQSCFAGTGAIVRLPQCQWSKPDEYGKISQCITTTKHSKAKTVCIFLGIYCITQSVFAKSAKSFVVSLGVRSLIFCDCVMLYVIVLCYIKSCYKESRLYWSSTNPPLWIAFITRSGFA